MLWTYLPEQEHQQCQHQDASQDRHHDDPPGNPSVLGHSLLWEHGHSHLTGRSTVMSEAPCPSLGSVTVLGTTWCPGGGRQSGGHVSYLRLCVPEHHVLCRSV